MYILESVKNLKVSIQGKKWTFPTAGTQQIEDTEKLDKATDSKGYKA